MGFFSPYTKDDALKQIGKINQEMRAIKALIYFNNTIEGRIRRIIKMHYYNIISYWTKYEKIKRNLSVNIYLFLYQERVDIWNNGEQISVINWETEVRTAIFSLKDGLNF